MPSETFLSLWRSVVTSVGNSQKEDSFVTFIEQLLAETKALRLLSRDHWSRDREAELDLVFECLSSKPLWAACRGLVPVECKNWKFDSPAVKEQVREMQSEGQAVIDNESRELLAVHHTGFIVAEAGQIYRGYTNSDHGIDGEIEFKDDQGRASGKRLYVQLKSGDSYLKKRRSDGAEVFQIKNPRWADYWQQQAYAVMLVIRTSDGEIRWMDVSAYLKRESAGGKTVRQIVFEGERFDVMSVRRWRERVLGATQPR